MTNLIGTVYDWKGQGGVQSHATRNGKTLCGRTPTQPRWDAIELVSGQINGIHSLCNVSCNRCRQIMRTYVNTDAIPAAAREFLAREAAK